MHRSAAFFALKGYRVEHGLVQLDILWRVRSIFAQFRTAAHDMVMSAIRAHPHGQGSSPIALPADAPVDNVFKEITHAAFADGFGNPIYLFIVFNQSVAHGSGLHKPALPCIVDERSVAAPAEGVTVFIGKFPKQPFARFKVGNDGLIGFLNESAVPRGAAGEPSAGVNKLNKRKLPFPADACVVFAECGGKVNYARTVGKGYVIVRNNAPCIPAFVVDGEIKQRFIVNADKLRTFEACKLGCVLAENIFNKLSRKNVFFSPQRTVT